MILRERDHDLASDPRAARQPEVRTPARAARQAEVQAARLGIVRRAVLESAGALFAAKGYDGATMAGVAADAGVSLKALYAVFASKEALIEAVLADHFEKHIAPLLAERWPDLAPEERLFAFLDGILAAMEADRDYLVLGARGSAALPVEMREKGRDPYAQFIGRTEEHLVSLIRDAQDAGRGAGVDPGDLATALMASLVALARKTATTDPSRPLTHVGTTLRVIYGAHLNLRTGTSPGRSKGAKAP
jgi:AcrR family transcriptional regulator